jgi:dethiobiotin synthetase
VTGLFVAGTDTGIGKTAVGCVIAGIWRARGLTVGVAKPVETGCDPDPLDAKKLAEAAGDERAIEEICPYRFREPLAPAVAAAREGRPIDPARLLSAITAAARGHDRVLAETAGGLLVPYADDCDAIDLVRDSGLPVLLVGRLGLGTINHTRLSVEALRARKVKIAGVVLSVGGRETAPPPGDVAAETNPATLRALLPGIPVVVFPHLDPRSPPKMAGLEEIVV